VGCWGDADGWCRRDLFSSIWFVRIIVHFWPTAIFTIARGNAPGNENSHLTPNFGQRPYSTRPVPDDLNMAVGQTIQRGLRSRGVAPGYDAKGRWPWVSFCRQRMFSSPWFVFIAVVCFRRNDLYASHSHFWPKAMCFVLSTTFVFIAMVCFHRRGLFSTN
jgi:hypothetical protein